MSKPFYGQRHRRMFKHVLNSRLKPVRCLVCGGGSMDCGNFRWKDWRHAVAVASLPVTFHA
jgi:hypothetical protein